MIDGEVKIVLLNSVKKLVMDHVPKFNFPVISILRVKLCWVKMCILSFCMSL